MIESCRHPLIRVAVVLTAAAAGLASAFLFPVLAWAGDARSSDSNRARLERMTRPQRLQVWERYQEFLALPKPEQERIRRLSADLQALPAAKRDRYKSMMDQFRKWRDGLPLYQRQRLEDAAQQGSAVMYDEFRKVQKEQDLYDRERPYWLLLDRPRVQALLPKILSKLTPEQIEQLDQTSPLDRADKLLEFAQQQGLIAPGPVNPQRLRGRLPLPMVTPEKLFEFRKTLTKQQLDELNDLALLKKNAQLQRVLEWYYDRHPEELPEGFRRGEPPMGPRNPGGRPLPRKDEPGPGGRTTRPPGS